MLGIVALGCQGVEHSGAVQEQALIEPQAHALALWPFPRSELIQLASGVTRRSDFARDGTRVELYEFDFSANPRLDLELFDQDQDDAMPLDNGAAIDRTIDQVVAARERKSKTRVLLAWNGPFFAYDRSGPEVVGRHIGPVVLEGKTLYNVGNHRWTLGWKGALASSLTKSDAGSQHSKIGDDALAGSLTKSGAGSPHSIELVHLPPKAELLKYRFAVSGVQGLIKDGKPLALEPFPRFTSQIKKGPIASTDREAGHIPIVDHIRTSRTSLAWNKAETKLYVLLVFEPDHELGSKLRLKRGEAQQGGWTLADLQRFWISFGAWGAINSDGGDVTQRWVRLPNRSDYVAPKLRQGTLMSFLVVER